MLSRIPTPVQQALAIVLPLICLITAYVLTVPRYLALRRDEAELQRTSAVVASKRLLIAQAEHRGPIPPVIARVPSNPNEAIAFLRQLSGVARACGVNVTGYTSSPGAPVPAAPAAPAAGTGAPVPTEGGLPPGTISVDLQLSVTGPYPAMARFFASLENYKRLISVNNVTMSAAGTESLDLSAQFRLTRYVGPPSPAGGAVTTAL